jgi:hypothetical protein
MNNKLYIGKNIEKYIKKESEKYINEYSDDDYNLENYYDRFTTSFFYKKYLARFLFIVHVNNKIDILFDIGDSRKKIIIEIVTRNINLIKKKIGKLPDFFLPFYVSDSHFFINNDIPFFIEAKPSNTKGILYPDKDYYYINLENKFINYNEFKELLINKNCSNINKKINKIYFSGANTGSKEDNKWNIRMKLKEITEKDKNYEIHIEDKFIPMYKFCNYKYLLNLPGHQPWSYRMTKILLMDSLIFDVVVLQRYLDKNNKIDKNKKWIQFFSNYFKPGKDYIEIKYEWTENLTKNDEVYDKIYEKINKLFNYYQNNIDEYKKITNSAKKKAYSLNLDIFDKTYEYLILSFIEKIYKNNSNKDVKKFIKKMKDISNRIILKNGRICLVNDILET